MFNRRCDKDQALEIPVVFIILMIYRFYIGVFCGRDEGPAEKWMIMNTGC